MKVIIDTKTETKQDAISIINLIYDKKIDNDNKLICHKCGINIFEKYEEETANKINNYCKIKYKINDTDKYHVFCKDCQKTVGGSQ